MTALNYTETGPEPPVVNQQANSVEVLVKLVKTSQEGDLDAFGKLVERFQKMALALAYYRLGDFHLAQDVAQETFIEAYINLPKLLEPAAFSGWFRKIVRKRIDRVTRSQATPPLDLEQAETLGAPMADPLQQAELRESRAELHELVAQLPAGERTVITLFYLNDYSQNEIANFLEVPLSTVKKRLYSGRQRLKESLSSSPGQPIKKQKVKKDLLAEKVQFLLAVRAGNLKKVAALLNKYPALALATEEYDEESARKFYVPMAQGQSALWRATHNGQVEMVELLLAKSKQSNQPLPLEEAVLMDHLKIAEIFIRAGAEVNAPLKSGLTLLTIAVIRENEAMVELLLAHHAEVNRQGKQGRTPLHWAVLKGNLTITKQLLAAGAKPCLPDESGQTSLNLARQLNNQALLEVFEPFSRPE